MKRIVIVGASVHGQVVADILLAMSKLDSSIKVEGFVDDDLLLQGYSFLGLPVLGPISSLSHYSHDSVVIAIGDNRTRRALRNRLLSSGESFASPDRAASR